MSAVGCAIPVCNGLDKSDTTPPLFDPSGYWLNNLTPTDALEDSPVFRQSLAKAELLTAQIQAHYSVTLESCRQAIKTGKAFATALSNLAQSIDLSLLPSQTYSSITTPSPRSGLDCNPLEGLHQVQDHLLRVSNSTAQLALGFKAPVQSILEAQKQMTHLFNLRDSFHRTSDEVDSALAKTFANRSQSDLSVAETDVDVNQIFRNTAKAYLECLRTAVGVTPLLTYLHSNSTVVKLEKHFVDSMTKLNTGPPDGPLEPPSVLIEFLNKLTHYADTTCRMTKSPDQLVSQSSLDAHKTSSNEIRMEGYLFKRTSKRSWRTWTRRWFRLSQNQLSYSKRLPCLSSVDVQSVISQVSAELTSQLNMENASDKLPCGAAFTERLLSQFKPSWKIMEPDLRLCTAREGPVYSDRRFTFELVSHGNRIHVLQADSFEKRERWIDALRSGLLHLQHLNHNDQIDSSKLSLSTPTDSRKSNVLSDSGDLTAPNSQKSSSNCKKFKNQGGTILWQDPFGSCNQTCADCLAAGADWASINLGVTLCTHCAAAHRSLGVHVSKIRSLTLDNWEPELLHMMLNLGNRCVNSIYEAEFQAFSNKYPRPAVSAAAPTRLQWIRSKWVHCQFVRFPVLTKQSDPIAVVSWVRDIYNQWREQRTLLLSRLQSCHDSKPSSPKSSDQERLMKREKRSETVFTQLSDTFVSLHRQMKDEISTSSRRGTLLRTQEQELASSHLLLAGAWLGCPPMMLAGLSTGAPVDGNILRDVSAGEDHPPPLIAAVRSGSLASCEFLLLNGADIDIQDHSGQTALHHACLLHRVQIVCLLLRRHADQYRKDAQGRDPLDIAIDLADADIVTLLRLQRLHDDADREACSITADDTITDVFRDYTSHACFFDSDDEQVECANLKHACSSPTIVHPSEAPLPTSLPRQFPPPTQLADTRRRHIFLPRARIKIKAGKRKEAGRSQP